MNLLHFRYFIEVAQTLNFTKASKNLNISQPGLSQQINALENELGFKLFHRTTKEVKLTEEGEYLYNKLSSSFQKIEYTIEDIRKNINLPITTLKIATVPSAASTILPKVLESTNKKFPELNFLIQETSSSEAINLVFKKKSHIALIRTPEDQSLLLQSGLKFKELQKHPVKLIVSSAHELAKQKEVELENLKHEKFINHHEERSHSLYSLLEKACRLAGFTPHTICIVSELLSIINLVKSNVGISIMPEDIVQMVNTDKIKSIQLKNQYLYSSITIVWEDHFYLNSLINDVIKIIDNHHKL
ncbi:LysR family transcriptional regulator [Pseudalkalibacillus decolorationis]|uniref:LysR family transcriptional regulator n=1 Tax=Pseudalkalibacillus decolorationis TaxID=163879 RepID=UPI0021494D19|nr:LysR family transcriptional regulator [Pseudalkalibacillus decolorationis]